ncbi:MAG TPA: hypothetical protein VKQ52_21350 [Puia sp.]|nr:hypothetical protein [Puia sp.]
MKRRTFIFLAGATALTIPFGVCRHRSSSLIQTLGQPDFLGRICDETTIADIGAAYCARTPDESQEEKLVSLLLANRDGNHDRSSSAIDSSRLVRQLNLAIQDDYTAGRVVTVKGWVLSLTEARQCALYTLSHQ